MGHPRLRQAPQGDAAPKLPRASATGLHPSEPGPPRRGFREALWTRRAGCMHNAGLGPAPMFVDTWQIKRNLVRPQVGLEPHR